MSPVLQVDGWIETAGIFVAALSGGIAGMRRGFDSFGIVVLAWVTGLGGGIMRDLMIGATPPVGISEPRLVIAAAAAGLLVQTTRLKIDAMRRSILVLDALALSLFVVLGTGKALAWGAGVLPAVIVGTMTGIGGGMLRDTMTGTAPLVLTDRQFYAIPALLGATAYACAVTWGFGELWIALVIMACVFGLRIVSIRFHWELPSPAHRRGNA